MKNPRAIISLIAASVMAISTGYSDDIQDKSNNSLFHLYHHYLESDYPKAMEYAELFLDSGMPISDDSTAAICDRLAEYYESELFRFRSATEYREKALSIYRETGNAGKEASTEFKLGQINYYLGQYDKTLDFATHAYDYYRSQKDSTGMMDCMNLIGIVNLSCNEFNTAIDSFNECLEIAVQNADSSRFARALNNISAYQDNVLRDTAKARSLLRASMDICLKSRDTTSLFNVYSNLVSSYLKSSENDKAQAALPYLESLCRDIRTTGIYHYLAGGCYYYNQEYDKAVDEFTQAAENLKQGDFPEQLMGVLNILSDTYYRKGDAEKSIETLRQYQKLKDEFINPGMYTKVFQKQKQIQEEQIRAKHLQETIVLLTISVISALLMIVVTVVLYIIYTRKMKAVKGKEDEIRSRKEILEIGRTQAYRKDKIIEDAISRLRKVCAKEHDPVRKDEINAICNELSRSQEDSDEWKEIRDLIPDFNSENFQKLIHDFPNLSINERRLCAFLNKNMTTKEISDITHQSVHSITIARARLRHKLGLTGNSISIQEFLSKYN